MNSFTLEFLTFTSKNQIGYDHEKNVLPTSHFLDNISLQRNYVSRSTRFTSILEIIRFVFKFTTFVVNGCLNIKWHLNHSSCKMLNVYITVHNYLIFYS